MRKLYVAGLALFAVLAYSIAAAGSASAFTLWDECKEVEAGGGGLFTNSDCNAQGEPFSFAWAEIAAATAVESLTKLLELTSHGVTVGCENRIDGLVGPGRADEVAKLLNAVGEEVTLTKTVRCLVTADLNLLCGGVGTEVEVAPENLPWKTELVAEGDLLANGKWWIHCLAGLMPTNECEKADAVLKVENLEAELEVNLTFDEAEEATCTVGTGKVKGTVSIFLTGTGRALRAM